MKKTVSAHVYNTIERYPQILQTPKVEKAMRNLKCWMALRVNRGFDNSSYSNYSIITLTDTGLPFENLSMEPQYFAEELIKHPNHLRI